MTVERQDWIVGHTHSGSPVYLIAGGAEEGTDSAGSGDGGGGAGDGDKGDGKPSGDAEFRPVTSQDALDKIVQQRLARERAKFADYDDAKSKAAEFDKLQEASKTEQQRATEATSVAIKERDEAIAGRLRLEVAIEKGLTTAQAKRLVGSTKEELEADADELLATFRPAGDDKGKPGSKPSERLRGGGDPTEDAPEMDPRKLAERIPRGY